MAATDLPGDSDDRDPLTPAEQATAAAAAVTGGDEPATEVRGAVSSEAEDPGEPATEVIAETTTQVTETTKVVTEPTAADSAEAPEGEDDGPSGSGIWASPSAGAGGDDREVDEAADSVKERAEAARERAAATAESAKERAGAAAEVAREKAGAAAETAKERACQAADAAKETGGKVRVGMGKAAAQARVAASDARDRAAKATSDARDRAASADVEGFARSTTSLIDSARPFFLAGCAAVFAFLGFFEGDNGTAEIFAVGAVLCVAGAAFSAELNALLHALAVRNTTPREERPDRQD